MVACSAVYKKSKMTIRKINARVPVLGLICLWAVFACSTPPAEQQIRENTKKIQVAIENKKADKVLAQLAEQFEAYEASGKSVNRNPDYYLDKHQLKKLMLLQFLRHKNIRVNLSAINIELDPIYTDRASMKTTAIITGATGWLPDDGRIYPLVSQWRYIDGDWYMTELAW